MNNPGKLRAVLVGCGGISSCWLAPVVQFKDVELVALVDIKPENARQARDKHGLVNALVSTSLAEALDRTHPDIVFDCTVPSAHASVTIQALAKGCHVLGEKPMADSMANAVRMLAAARRHRRLYAVIQNRRYLDHMVRFRDFLRGGAIGRLTTLNADFYIGAHFGGFRDAMPHPLLLDMAIHSFDEARYISGADPRAVYCHEWNPRNSWYRHAASAMAIFEMTGGVVFNYRGSWCAEGLNTSWECAWRATGEKGSVLWDGRDGFQVEIAKGSKGFFRPQQKRAVPRLRRSLRHPGHAGVIREFLDCVKSGGTPQTICRDNIKSLAMVHFAIDSARQGRRIRIAY